MSDMKDKSGKPVCAGGRVAPQLPPIFNGKCGSLADWEKRRAEMLALLSEEEYGAVPPSLESSAEITEQKLFFAGKGMLETVILSFPNAGETFSFPVRLAYPARKERLPFIVFANFSQSVPDKHFPAEELIDNGVGVISFYYSDVSVDKNTFGDGAEKLFADENGNKRPCGKISLWAWGMSAALDYLLRRDLALPEFIAAAGHSRLGKTALWAAANDSRFSFVFSNDSGCSGAAVSRGKTGETIEDITRVFPHWFCENFYKYAGHEYDMPFDQHFLLALIAPRTLAVGAAEQDTWADTFSQYVACKAADEAYRFFGKGGGFEDAEPITGKEYGVNALFFRERPGTHFFSRDDWHYYLAIMRRAIGQSR